VPEVFEIDDRPHPRRVLVLMISTIVFIAILPFAAMAPRLIDVVQVIMIGSAILVCSTSRRTLSP
jgi:hypothetical protein